MYLPNKFIKTFLRIYATGYIYVTGEGFDFKLEITFYSR